MSIPLPRRYVVPPLPRGVHVIARPDSRVRARVHEDLRVAFRVGRGGHLRRRTGAAPPPATRQPEAEREQARLSRGPWYVSYSVVYLSRSYVSFSLLSPPTSLSLSLSLSFYLFLFIFLTLLFSLYVALSVCLFSHVCVRAFI